MLKYLEKTLSEIGKKLIIFFVILTFNIVHKHISRRKQYQRMQGECNEELIAPYSKDIFSS